MKNGSSTETWEWAGFLTNEPLKHDASECVRVHKVCITFGREQLFIAVLNEINECYSLSGVGCQGSRYRLDSIKDRGGKELPFDSI